MSPAMKMLRERVSKRQSDLVRDLELRNSYAGDPNPGATQYIAGKAEVLGQVLIWIDELGSKRN